MSTIVKEIYYIAKYKFHKYYAVVLLNISYKQNYTGNNCSN